MDTRLSSKMAALGLALLLNGAVFGGIVLLLSAERAVAACMELAGA